MSSKLQKKHDAMIQFLILDLWENYTNMDVIDILVAFVRTFLIEWNYSCVQQNLVSYDTPPWQWSAEFRKLSTIICSSSCCSVLSFIVLSELQNKTLHDYMISHKKTGSIKNTATPIRIESTSVNNPEVWCVKTLNGLGILFEMYLFLTRWQRSGWNKKCGW